MYEPKRTDTSRSILSKFSFKVDEFIDYCKKRELDININYLEYLEKEGIFKPLMRVKEEYVNNSSYLKELYQNGYVNDPRQKDYVPWERFYEEKDGYKQEIIHTYYHPYQIYFLTKILNNELRINSFSFPQEDNELLTFAREWEVLLKKSLKIHGNYCERQERFVQLLLFIQNKYLPLVKQPGHSILTENIWDSANNNLFKKLDHLQKTIIPEEIIKTLCIEVDEIKRYRDSVGGQGLSIDPLTDWYDLIKYINYDKRQELKGKALLAQDFYLISDMLALLLEDLTGRKQLETGSLNDSMQGRGKSRFYGKELNYVDRDILIIILRSYGLNPRPRLILIVEGYTEEAAFPIISGAMDIPLERFDIEIINIRGANKHPRALIIYHSIPDIYKVDKEYHIHPERTKVFIIFDNEGGKRGWLKKFIDDPDKEIEGMMKEVLSVIEMKKTKNAEIDKIFLEKTVKHRIWNKSFEYDNFTDEELSRELNKYGKNHEQEFNITSSEISECRNRNGNLDEFVREKTANHTNLKKKEFGEQLASLIAKEIAERPNKFENQRPIEKLLVEVVNFTVE